MPFRILSMAFHLLLITAERPGLGLVTTISNAVVCFLRWRKGEQSGDLPEPDESEQE